MYNYNTQRPHLFSEQGQVMFLKIRDNVNKLLKEAGAVMMSRAISSCTGDTWDMLACVDRLVELGEIREIPQDCAGQHRVFVENLHTPG